MTASHRGCVGPYWFVRDDRGQIVLLSHLCSLDIAEPYGEFLTCPHGHYEVWEGWRASGVPHTSAATAVNDYEYEEWPRGRVVFNYRRSKFIIYADVQIFREELQLLVLERFQIASTKVEFSRDEHYVSTRALSSGEHRDD